MDTRNFFKAELNFRWIKANSGNSYLCPVGALEELTQHTDEELGKVCVEESNNPQNN